MIIISTFRVAPVCVFFVLIACKHDPPSAITGLHVPEGFVIEQAVPDGMVTYPMFATLDNRGRLFVMESSGHTTSTKEILENPTFFIRLLEDVDGDGVYDRSVVFADSIPYPMGGTFHRGSFYTAAPPDLLRLTDTDGDGVADEREVILTGWVLSHNAATLSGPFPGPDGWMYLCDARRGFDITTKEGTRLQGKGARIWRCRPDGTGLESVSGGGFDNTVELAFMPSGESIGTMTYFTDPRDGLRDALMHWVEGGVYPKHHAAISDDALKMTGDLMPVMTKLARVSHAGIMRYRGTAFGGEFQGNLFTAEFNTGRLMRHTVTPEAATYRATTEPFLTSSIPDYHPTDVLEDADGSLLFVNTGGWFIAGCPLSVVAKTDVHGGIFRIRKNDSPRIDDPWGHDIDMKSRSPEQLTGLMEDTRHVVRDNAAEELILRRQSSAYALATLLKSSSDSEVRIAAVFALYRIGGQAAMEQVVAALDDRDVGVRVAAARACGLAREKNAVDKLLHIVANDQAPARRQAATALGQIGEKSVVGQLLSAAEHVEDRFVEHAITYALITLQHPAPLVEALAHVSGNIRKSALIALDQMEGSPLQKSHITPFLHGKDTSLRSTASWVLMHHPSWSDVVLSFLKEQSGDTPSNAKDTKALTDLMIAFGGDAPLQQWMADQLNSAAVADADRRIVLDAMRRSQVKEFPAVWMARLEMLLAKGSREMQEHVLTVLEARRIAGLEKKLSEIFMDPGAAPSFRLKALSARMIPAPQLTDNEFEALLKFLDHGAAPAFRQSAVRILVQADLSDRQLLTIARDHIPGADPILLPGLVSAFEGCQSKEAGDALISALSSSPERLDMLSLPELERIFASFIPEAREHSAALLETVAQRQATRLSALKELQASLGRGDVGEGRELFYGKALCSTCHAVAGNGADFGPDLTNIGEIRSEHDILEAIVYPGASFAREYETSRIVTASATYTGIVKEQLPDNLVIGTGPGVVLRIPVSDITAIEPQELSMMPPGLHQHLSHEELSDLMAYLRSLPDGLGHLRE